MMAKGQVPVAQYILFFTINFSVFIAVSSLFKFQLDRTQDEVEARMIKIIGDEASLNIVSLLVSCKECDYGEVTLDLPPALGNNYVGISGNGDEISVYVLGISKEYNSTVFNLGKTITFTGKSQGRKELKLIWEKQYFYLVVG